MQDFKFIVFRFNLLRNIQKVISITTLSFSSAEKSFPKHHKYHRVNVPLGMRENRNLGCMLCNIVKSCISNLQTYHEQKYLFQNIMRPKKILFPCGRRRAVIYVQSGLQLYAIISSLLTSTQSRICT